MLTRMSKLSPVLSVCLHGLEGRLLVPYKQTAAERKPPQGLPGATHGSAWLICAGLRQ